MELAPATTRIPAGGCDEWARIERERDGGAARDEAADDDEREDRDPPRDASTHPRAATSGGVKMNAAPMAASPRETAKMITAVWSPSSVQAAPNATDASRRPRLVTVTTTERPVARTPAGSSALESAISTPSVAA